MKTIALPNFPRAFFGAALVLGGLAALYLYRRNGGTVSDLVGGAKDLFGKASDAVNDAVGEVADDTQGFAGKAKKVARRVRNEIPTDPEALDRVPAL